MPTRTILGDKGYEERSRRKTCAHENNIVVRVTLAFSPLCPLSSWADALKLEENRLTCEKLVACVEGFFGC